MYQTKMGTDILFQHTPLAIASNFVMCGGARAERNATPPAPKVRCIDLTALQNVGTVEDIGTLENHYNTLENNFNNNCLPSQVMDHRIFIFWINFN